MKPYIIGLDPSGSYNEGMGTTGVCVIDPECKLIEHAPVCATDHTTQLTYWKAVIDTVDALLNKYPGAVLSVEDYVLYAANAKAQINSEMETSKLIGAITMFAFNYGTHLYIRNASLVKKRWTNDILESEGIIQKVGNRWCDRDNKIINPHCLDAVRHAVHCHYFEIGKDKWLK